jgi:tRNA(His) 5'-end guanylyltransferase
MKEIEKRENPILPDFPYYIIRLDGRAFHTYTKRMKDHPTDPFNDYLHKAFIHSCVHLAKEVSGCLAVYTQSDEISILMRGIEENSAYTPWFGLKRQKIVSISASVLTAYFNNFMDNSGYDLPFAFFDSRVFGIDQYEVNNYFLWRQQDAIRNSISMYAQKNFSHNDLQGKSSKDMKDMLADIDLVWEDLDTWKRRGSLVINKTTSKDVEWTDKKGKKHEKKDVTRREWTDVKCPKFNKHDIFKIVDKYGDITS